MTAKRRGKLPATVGPTEVLRDSRGRVVDDEYVDQAVETAVEYARGRGRPSLSASGESPLVRVRVSGELKAQIARAAQSSGQSTANWIRAALERAVREAS